MRWAMETTTKISQRRSPGDVRRSCVPVDVTDDIHPHPQHAHSRARSYRCARSLGSDAFSISELRRQELPCPVQCCGRFVEDRVKGLELSSGSASPMRGIPGWTRCRQRRIADGVDPEVIHAAQAAAGSVAGVVHAHARSRWTGRTLRVEVGGWVDPDLTARDADALGRRMADAIAEQLPEAGSPSWATRAALA
jgi:hypothetical protein